MDIVTSRTKPDRVDLNGNFAHLEIQNPDEYKFFVKIMDKLSLKIRKHNEM